MAHGQECVDALRQAIRPTTLIQSEALDQRVGAKLIVASETFQHTGSFKFRAAYNVAQKKDAKRFIAASSGNFGQALAYACSLLGKSCTIVMPDNSAQVKIDAVRRFGGIVELVDVKKVTRAQRVEQLADQQCDAIVVSAYDDPLVVEGNASLGDELSGLARVLPFDCVVVPVGGGGLSAGILLGMDRSSCQRAVYGAEPLMANDAARSLRSGQIEVNEAEPQTIADGARTVSLGTHNWEILKEGLAGIVEVTEESIRQAVLVLFEAVNLKVEPTGALAVAAVLQSSEQFKGKTVCCIVSGGNVDAEVYCRLISAI